MRRSRVAAFALTALPWLGLLGPAQAAPVEPTPESVFRPLRTDFVKSWHIYNDRNVNGILDPGDEKIDEFENWWTPASAHSQYNYQQRWHASGEDWAAAPLSLSSRSDPDANYWLPRQENAIHFYMAYSQFDNNDWRGGYDYGQSGDALTILKQRNEFRNGWALGWVTHEMDQANSQVLAGSVRMDVFVHNGRAVDAPVQVPEWAATWGTESYSNPQVAASNDISELMADNVASPGQLHPPQFDDAAGEYSWSANALRMGLSGLDAGDLAQIVCTMEVREHDPASLGPAEVIWPSRRPSQIEADLTDHTGQEAYVYQDAFTDRCFYHEGSNDGGVLAGLAGQDDYDIRENNWGDLQVIRVDVSPETLSAGDPNVYGNITSVVIYDFGAPGTGEQVSPRAIALDLTGIDPDTQLELFPEARFYISSAEIIPEPACAAILVLGGVGLCLKRRR